VVKCVSNTLAVTSFADNDHQGSQWEQFELDLKPNFQ
jgi:hypothetical protein